MKPIRFSRFLAQSKTMRSCGLALAAPALVLTVTSARAGTEAPATAPEAAPLTNWVDFVVGGAFVSGDDAAMQARTRTNGDFYGGIRSFQYSQDLKNSTTLTLDGHALPGLEDYEFNLDLTKTDLGYVKAGYKQFRTWYDGSGGYMPAYPTMYKEPAGGDELHIDRGEFYLEAGLRMENLPEVTFSYNHAFRNGQKDSTGWGDIQQAGTSYKIMPSMWDIDEKIDTFRLDVTHTLGNTDLGAGLTYEHVGYTDSRINSRGYLTSVPLPSSTTPPSSGSIIRTGTSTDEYTMDLFSGNVHSETRFNDKVWLTLGFAYTSADTNNDGASRTFAYPYGNGTDTGYNNGVGGGQFSQFVGNLNVMWNPIPDLTVTPSLRFEHEDSYAWLGVVNYKPAGQTDPVDQAYANDGSTDSTIGALDLRYTGISDVLLYAKGQWGHEDKTNLYRDVYTPPSLVAPTDFLNDDIKTDEQQYTLGANWYPLSGLSFALQGLYSERNNSLSPFGLNGPGGTLTIRPDILEHDTTVDDLNLRVTWRPLNNVSLVTRYDYRDTQYRNGGVKWSPPTVPPAGSPAAANIYAEVQSGDVSSNIISESINWTPMARLYLQASASFTWAQTDTNSVWIPDSDNDYISGSLTAGYAIDDRTDLTLTYTYYGASNYSVQGLPYTTPTMGFGLNTQEHAVSVTLNRVLTPNMVWNLSYGFISSNTDPMPDQTGGFNDFVANMVSTGLQIRF